jgi:hypothetical protein
VICYQDNIFLVVDKHTTNSYYEEREAYVVLKGATRRIISILKHFKIDGIRKYIMRVEKQADAMIAASDREALLLTGPREKITYVDYSPYETFLLMCVVILKGPGGESLLAAEARCDGVHPRCGRRYHRYAEVL